MATEKRLIDANALVEQLGKSHEYHARTSREEVLLYRDIRIINEQPTVDAVEVVHGRWVQGYPISCSVCGGAAATDYEDTNRYEAWLTPYCPNCGAKMDGEKP